MGTIPSIDSLMCGWVRQAVDLAVDSGRARGDMAHMCTVLGRRCRYDRSTDDVTIFSLLIEL